jgi:hypothetical protein
MTDPVADPDPRSDQELVRLYHAPELDRDGRALQTIYRRHADAVLGALQADGLPEPQAQECVGVVFLRALNCAAVNVPLVDLLLREARAVVQDSNRVNPEPLRADGV